MNLKISHIFKILLMYYVIMITAFFAILYSICFSERARNNGSLQTSDDDSFNDNASVISSFSEACTVDEPVDEVDEISQQEQFEEKLSEALEGLTQKSAQGRTNSFESVCKAFIKKYVPDYVLERYVFFFL